MGRTVSTEDWAILGLAFWLVGHQCEHVYDRRGDDQWLIAAGMFAFAAGAAFVRALGMMLGTWP